MKKMMLNDVAEYISEYQNNESILVDINKIPKELDSDLQIKINLNIKCGIILELENNLRKKFGENHPSVNGYICNIIENVNKEFQLQQHTTSLLFDGKEPRKDTLEKLFLIANEFELDVNFPNLKRRYVEFTIKKVLNNPDPRTVKKYVNCITRYVEESIGRHIYFNQDYYLENFKKTVLEKIRKSEKFSNEEIIELD